MNQRKVNDAGLLSDRSILPMILVAISLKNWKSIIWTLSRLTFGTRIKDSLRLSSERYAWKFFLDKNKYIDVFGF